MKKCSTFTKRRKCDEIACKSNACIKVYKKNEKLGQYDTELPKEPYSAHSFKI
tara:strand:- start:519 stop:677 length:159 start_codon:yes stop_codon:yes gene_type:complete